MTAWFSTASGGAGSTVADELIGRDREMALLAQHLTMAAGHGGALLLQGAPGAGKTALATAFGHIAVESGACYLHTGASPAESGLPFVGLHQLLGDRVADLTAIAPQRRQALLAAFGLAEPTSGRPEPFLIGLAVLDLLTALATDRPTVIVVEDAHWLDRETADLLAFVLRRLARERILLLATARPGYHNALIDAVEDTLTVGPLSPEAAGELIDRAAPHLTPAARSRVLGWAAGNPLALLELPHAGEETPAGIVPATDRLGRAFTTRSLTLPEAVRTALLITAVDDHADLREILSAASAAAGTVVAVGDLACATTAGLIRIDAGRVTFRHALVRSAVHEEASGEQRRQAHLALAGVLAGQPERQIWHRAAASLTPDAELAGELERVAASAQRRGGLSTASAALRHAIALSPAGPDRLRRLLDAAALAFQLGDRELLASMVSRAADAGPLGPAEKARLEYLSEAFDFKPWTATSIEAAVGRARAATAAGHPAAALDLLGSVVARSYMGGADERILRRVTDALDELNLPADQPGVLRVYAYAAPVARGEQLLHRLHAALPAAAGDADRLYDIGMAAGPLGDAHLQVAALVPAVEELRRRGRISITASALWALSTAQYFTGDWSAGRIAAAESTQLATDTGQSLWAAAARLTEAVYTAVRGEPGTAAGLVHRTLTEVPLFAPSQVMRANGMIALAEERYDEAYENFARVFVPGDPACHSALQVWLAVDLAEAGAAAGRRAEAEALLHDLDERYDRMPSPLLHVTIATARALLARDDRAEAMFTAAVRPQVTRWPFLRARTRLAFGTWLRRQRRVSESRTPLRAARDEFDQLGAAAWSERARRELRAAGERSRAVVSSPTGGLTAQELQIATLAAQGLTNREIGERLFLSHRTVSSYLYQTFPKLGVSSRQQLAAALARPPSPPQR
ncbi:AAA family ATPase [Actinoplanes sp. N902-109]|uniref:ATP-binding protein n=1 Tax=Actinoplanes sp. (strain N902-109) TaxID=649831 RepID=UPI0003294469|nr:AAA family ATPase [Actinoplanes sp. N902-109]AGL16340.1 LuxR family transcriptional regulator [Actinoplanes sp. N902-109]